MYCAFQIGTQEVQHGEAKKSAHGRAQERARVAGDQGYEVRYEPKKDRKSASAVKKAVKKVATAERKCAKRYRAKHFASSRWRLLVQLEMWLWKKSSLSSNLQWARVGGGSCLCRREKGQIPPRRLRNGIRGGTLDFDQSEILAQQTGRANVMPRVVAARQICWPVSADNS